MDFKTSEAIQGVLQSVLDLQTEDLNYSFYYFANSGALSVSQYNEDHEEIWHRKVYVAEIGGYDNLIGLSMELDAKLEEAQNYIGEMIGE